LTESAIGLGSLTFTRNCNRAKQACRLGCCPPDAPALIVNLGDRIVQLPFIPVPRPVFQLVDEFARAIGRGGGGFGSTGHGMPAGNSS
jgi:hypothetical protein